MKKILSLLLLIALVVAAVVTCPDKKAHRRALLKSINTYVDDKLDDSMGEKGVGGVLGSGIKTVKKVLGSPVASVLVNQYLEIDNYYLFSIGKVKWKDERKTVSFGAFGYVFAPSTEQIDKAT